MLPTLPRHPRRPGHTPLFSLVQASLAQTSLNPSKRPAPTVHSAPTSQVVRADHPAHGGPRIAIVGGGLAGLNAAHHLKKAGLTATVYDADTRLGGRVQSVPNAVAPGIVSEFGGEYIDTHHADIIALAHEFELPLLDRHSPEEKILTDAYFFGGRHYTGAQVVEAFAPLAQKLAADWERAEADLAERTRLDQISLAEYLTQIGASGWLYDLLDVAYLTEFGLDSHEQSCLNLLSLIGTDTTHGFQMYGDSTEQHKIQGGNEKIITALTERLAGQIEIGQRLVRLAAQGNGFQLTFETPSGPTREVDADFVLLALPFSVLRHVDLMLELPPLKTQMIAEMGQATNAKILLGVSERVWRTSGYNGYSYTDEALQVCWDGSQCQPGTAGALAVFLGGTAGLAVGAGTAADQVARLIPGAERLFPGFTQTLNGQTARVHWPSLPFARASYACYKPGQWTAFQGHEITPVGQLYFAGDHCSVEFQSYMNGAAETGRRAGQAIAAAIGGNPTPSFAVPAA